MALFYGTLPLVWEFGWIGSGKLITVPAFNPAGLSDDDLRLIAERRAVAPGVTDLASIPPAFRWLLAPSGPFVKAAALHDYLYITWGIYGWYTREECDAIFYEAMIATGIPEHQARIIWQGVRAGGGRAFGT
ncbi:DUF1353 domain-containing protein [Phenylobacterium sp.]|uniref:DUF1353 domain-containing protein n=1 Tax=Phenylobacterium sp. TaxID=1871053 RepID=UPI0025F9CF37|nr:DUF1353 domain-containing protein [Phenylobacterium sp.]